MQNDHFPFRYGSTMQFDDLRCVSLVHYVLTGCSLLTYFGHGNPLLWEGSTYMKGLFNLFATNIPMPIAPVATPAITSKLEKLRFLTKFVFVPEIRIF